jgi:hypothetical protein
MDHGLGKETIMEIRASPSRCDERGSVPLVVKPLARWCQRFNIVMSEWPKSCVKTKSLNRLPSQRKHCPHAHFGGASPTLRIFRYRYSRQNCDDDDNNQQLNKSERSISHI